MYVKEVRRYGYWFWIIIENNLEIGSAHSEFGAYSRMKQILNERKQTKLRSKV